MDAYSSHFKGDAVLHQQAIRIPLSDIEAERSFHESMTKIADARDQRVNMLAEPQTSLLTAHETELECIAECFEQQLENIAGDDHKAAARAYYQGKRDNRIAELTSYYLEGLWRLQQLITISDMMFFPLVIRYPESFTLNIRFASCHTTDESVHYESPEHLDEHLDKQYAKTYYEESQYSQREATDYLRDTAQVIRDEFPDPDETSFADRKCGGIVAADGRQGTVFSSMLKRIEPDLTRFSKPPDHAVLVSEGPEAKRTEQELLPNSTFVL